MTSVLAAARTPVCPVDGSLSGLHPVDMAAAVLRELVAGGPVGVDEIDEVWVGCAEPVGAQGADMARAAVLSAGWPVRIAGMVVDAAETSGSTALHAAIAAVETGAIRRAVVLGVSSSSIVPPGASALSRTYGRPWSDGPTERFADSGGLLSPHRAADATAASLRIDRVEQDLAVSRSLERRRASDPSRVVAIAGRTTSGAARRRGASVGADVLRDLAVSLSRLPPAFDPDGTITAASFAPPADGVSGLIIGPTPDDSDRKPLGRIVSFARSSGDPGSPAGGARAAVQAAVDQADLKLSDVSNWEIIESSAAALLSICRVLDLDPAIANTWGGALATGDSGAAEEIRLIVDSLDRLSVAGPTLALASGQTAAAATIIDSRPAAAGHRTGS